MNTPVEKEEVWAIMQIFMNAEASFKVHKQINKLENENALVARNDFLWYTKILCWRNTVTELAKLLSASDSDHYNLKDFFKRLKAEPTEAIPITRIEGWERTLSKKNKEINDLLLQRNKVYAHTDRDQTAVKNIVSMERTEELLDSIFEVIDAVYSHYVGSSISREPTSDIGDDLGIIAESLLMRDQILEKLENGELLM